jgi:hypothetical protein
MNANELADILQENKFQVDEDGVMICVSHQALDEAIAMLRQQQAEIEGLKAVLEQEGIGVGRDLLNGGIALFRKASEK